MPLHKNALEWLYQLGFEETSCQGNEHRGDCPICGKENNHFSINSEKGVFNCFSCGESGTYPSPTRQPQNVLYGTRHYGKSFGTSLRRPRCSASGLATVELVSPVVDQVCDKMSKAYEASRQISMS